jgi:hypothetical protein
MKLPPAKVAAIINLVMAAISYSIDRIPSSASTAYLTGGLAIFLLSREAVNDERVDHLKLKAISYGFSVGLLITLWTNVLSKMLKSFVAMPTLSAFDALNLILVVALVMFHFWRWQDGRVGSPEPHGK